jgi:two-component system response regulator AtoC
MKDIAELQPIDRKVLVVDDDAVTRKILDRFLRTVGCQVTLAESYDQALLTLAIDPPDVVLSDIDMPGHSGLELLQKIKQIVPDMTVILVTAQNDMRSTVQAMQQGAYDYLTKPIDFERLHTILRHAVSTQELSDRLSLIVDQTAQDYSLDNILIGRSRGMIEIYKTIGNVSQTKVTVLIEGESGTGKELIARAVHFNSPWKDQPFIAVNCTALTETLLESELFGHTKGSFTGAQNDKQGKFELAGEGTIFLDEIGEISHSIQVKLLRILQQREFERVGGDKTIPMLARIVAATNRDLQTEVKKGNFREDLYYRLNVVSVKVPSLRERKEDLENLVRHLLNKINHDMHTKVWKISEAAMQRIMQHDWPGNVRELENVLTRAIVLSKSDVLEAEVIPEPVSVKKSQSSGPVVMNADWRRTLEEVEREHMIRVLKAVNGNRTEAARVLGISKQTLYTRLPKESAAEGE